MSTKMESMSERQLVFLDYLLKRIGFSDSEYLENYKKYLEKTVYKEDREYTYYDKTYSYKGYDIIEYLIEEYKLKKVIS